MKAENETTEFKLPGENGKLPDSFIKSVVAFANSNGGRIYIGIDDNGETVGVENPDDIKKRAAGAIRDSIKPELLMFTAIRDVENSGKNIVVVEVQRGTDRPYYVAGKGVRPEGVYIRSGSASVPASETSIKQMIMETTGRSYERERSIEQKLTFTALENEIKNRGLELGESQMKTLGLLGGDGLYTNLALLLSEQCPFTIKIAVFEGTNSLVFKDRREVGGSVLTQLDEALRFIDYSNRTRATVGAKYRQDVRDYPPEAIREALLNCIVHRDYSFSSGSIVNIYEDRMEFISIGSLFPGLSIEAVMRGVSQSRNSGLAAVFYRLALVESYGTGIRKMINLFEGFKAPELSSETGGFFVTMYNRNFGGNGELPTSVDFGNNTEREELILHYVEEHGMITRTEAEKLLCIRQTAAYNILKKMCDRGALIRKTGGKLTGYCLNTPPQA